METVASLCFGCEQPFVKNYPAKKYCSRGCWLRKWNREDVAHTVKGAAAGSKAIGDKLRGTGSGYVKQNGRHGHRVAAEKKIGRALLFGEVVHHIDEDKSNNDPENLQVMTQSEHIRLHHKAMLKARKEKHGY